VASVVTECLERVASAGTGSATGSYFPYPRAGKTGTTENGWDVWYVGYTPKLAAAVWMGDLEKSSPMNSAYGGTYCAPMWAKFFAAALKDEEKPGFKDFPWTFSPWEGKMQAMSPSPSPSASDSATPSPAATKTITPKPTATKTVTPTPPPTPTKTPKPTPTATSSAAAKKVVTAAGAGGGGSGLAGAVFNALAGLLGI